MPSLTRDRRSQLLSHVRSDQQSCWKRGERVPVEQYLERYPELAKEPNALLDLVSAEVIFRLEVGDSPSLDEYRGRFPSLSDSLEKIWPSFHLLVKGPEKPTERTPFEHNAIVPPLSIPGFELLERLGEGGMGVVYKARQIDLDRVVALKLIALGPLAGERLLARFKVEERAVARLDHPNVVRIHATGQHQGWVYFCMEYAAGGSLADYLRQQAPEIREAAELVRRLALGAQHAHEAGVVHRDLKPANVLLSSPLESSPIQSPDAIPQADTIAISLAEQTPKISDFGLAKLLDSDEGLTLSGALLGTPSYMAIEQAESRLADIGTRTDVYALGAILYHCLTGRPPYSGKSNVEVLDLVRKQSPIAPRELRPEVPAELEAICLKCLEKLPEQRYQTAKALADDLQAWLDHKPASVQPPGRLRRFIRAIHKSPAMVAVALFFVALAGLGFFHILDSDRPLRQTQTQIRAGGAVELIGATGKPSWAKILRGRSTEVSSLDQEGICVVDGWSLTLIELLPDTQGCANYRIDAEIQHLRGSKLGLVGVYLAGVEQGPAKDILTFVRVAFNDKYDALEDYQAIAPNLRAKLPKPKGNRVLIEGWHVGRAVDSRFSIQANLAGPEVFKPVGHAGAAGAWRSVGIEVTPERLRTFWQGQVVDDRLLKSVSKSLAAHNVAQIKHEPNWQGSIGLCLFESSAAVRNVRFTPVAPNNPN